MNMMMACSTHHCLCKSVLLVVFGVLFFLGTLGVWPEFTFGKYWPLFVVVWGLHDAFCGCKKGHGHE